MMEKKFKARFFDGKNIQEKEAWVIILPESLKIIFIDNQIQQEYLWTKDKLQLLERPYHHKPALVGYKSMLGARLIIENQQDYESVLPLISPRNIKLSHIHHPWRITWVLVACLILVIWLLASRSHMISLWIANIIPYQWEQKLFDNEVKNYLSSLGEECVSPQGKKALDKLVSKLAEHTHTKQKFDVRVIDAPQYINAESLPGFHILIYSGMFGMNSVDSLGGVIAHEMGHSVKRHVMANFINQMGMNKFLASVLGLSQQSIALILLNQKYSRDYETQADNFSIELLKQSNVNPVEIRYAMEYLLKNSQEFEGLEAYFVDHPPFKERIENIHENEDPSKTASLLTKDEWKALKSICDVKIPLEYK